MVVCQTQQWAEVLVDHQHRDAGLLERLQAMPDLGAYQGRQAFGGLIQHQQPGIGHQRASDRQHLLFAARQVQAQVACALLQARKQLVHPLQGPRVLAAKAVVGRGHQILVDREIGEHLTLFRHQPDAQPRDLVRGQAGDVLTGEADAPGARSQDSHDRTYGGSLAHAVAPDHGDELALGHRQADTEQRLGISVKGLKIVDLEERAHSETFVPRTALRLTTATPRRPGRPCAPVR